MLNVMLDAWSSLTQPWCVPPPKAAFAPAAASKGDKFLARRFDGAEGALQYKLFIPDMHPGAPMPLVVMLHGGGQDADDFALGTRMNDLAAQYRCAVLYPQQSSGANWSMCWNWFDASHHHRGRGEPALLAALTRSVIAGHAIDPGRVYVAGLSAGGAMAVILGRTYPELFAAVGCHSGLAHGSATDSYGAVQAMKDGVDAGALPRRAVAASVPVIVFHGDMDYTVHPRNADSIVRQFLESHKSQRWHERVEVTRETGRAGGRAYTRQVHRGQGGRVLAEHWTINGTGHAWSGGFERGSYTDAGGPDASTEMLRFFLQRRPAGAPSPYQ